MKDNNVFDDVVKAQYTGADLIASRTVLLRPEEPSSGIDKHAKNTIALFLIRALKRYERTLRYVAKSTDLEDAESHYFALPHVRTMIDLYAKVLFLAGQPDDNSRAQTCIAYSVYSRKSISITYKGLTATA